MNRRDTLITIEDLKQGSDEALHTVYVANRQKFINFAKRYNLSNDEVLDVYQDAYIAFYENVMNGKITKFTSSISTYIISIGKFMIFNALKQKKKTTNDNYDFLLEKNDNELIENIEIDATLLSQEQKLLYEHYSNLGKKCIELLDLFYYRGYSIEDILKHTHYNSENVIKSTKSRCLKNLKERIFNHG